MRKHPRVQIEFDQDEGMTRQEFEPECEINNIMNKYQRTGVLTHINRFGAMYGDFDAVDFQTALQTIKDGEDMFAQLPSSTRKYFDNDPAAFMEFVNDPENIDKLVELGLAVKAPEQPVTTDPVPNPAPVADNGS